MDGIGGCSLQQIFEVCARLCAEDTCDTEEEAPTATVLKRSAENKPRNKTDNTDNTDNTDLPHCLSFCQAVHAPLATSLRQDLVQLLGKEQAKVVIQPLMAKTTRLGTETRRLFTFKGEPVALKEG